VKTRIFLALLALGIVFAGGAARADEPLAAGRDVTFHRGNDAYLHGHYADAVSAYEQVAALGVRSVDLFYNLGNAYLKSGQLGPAIYNYERALELDPGQEDAQFNLKAARAEAQKKAEDRLVGGDGTPMWQRAVAPYSVGTLGWLFFGLYGLLFTVLIVLHFVQPGFLRVGLWASFAFLMIGTGVAAALFGGRLYLANRVAQAVVLPDSVQIKDGPDANYTSSFSVHAGLRVRVTEKDQDWARVRLSNGLEGWLRERDLGRL
jgi:tetratricopeptide (TPR) repeat protein